MAQAKVVKLSGPEREAVLAYAEPLVDNLLEGFNEADYAKLSRDFDEQMKTLFPPKVFEQSRGLIQSKVGLVRSRAVEAVEKRGPYTLVIYHAAFEREEEVTVRVSLLDYGHGPRVAGLWFDSPTLRA